MPGAGARGRHRASWGRQRRAAQVRDPNHQALHLSLPPPAEVTSETFNKEAFLASRGLTRGYWTHISMLLPGPGSAGHPRGSMPTPNLLLNGT